MSGSPPGHLNGATAREQGVDIVREELTVLGPLPPLYRVVVAVCVLAAGLGLGAWLALLLPDVLVGRMGIGLGAALGVAAVIVLLHEPPHPHRRTVRIHRR